MKDLHGKYFDYPLMDLAEAYGYHTAIPVAWEQHTSWEIHHVLSGVVTYEFMDGSSIELRGGTFLVIPPRTRHRAMNGSAAPSTRLATRWSPNKPMMSNDKPPLSLSAKDIAKIFASLASSGLTARIMPRDMLRSAKELFNDVLQADRNPKGFTAALLRHRCNDLLIHLMIAANTPAIIAKDENVVSAVQRYIDAHLNDRHLRLPDLIRISGYGATQLNKLFQDRLGITPNEYLIRARVKKAFELLKGSKAPMIEIAHACGFSSAAYFSTVFRKYHGITPSQV